MNTKPPKRIGNANTRYNTPLSATEEAQYQKWVKTLPVNLRDDYDYDLRGAWLAKVKPDQYGHMPDLYKKPWHPTFSMESYYSVPPNEGGDWDEDNFIPSNTNEIMDAIRQSPFYQYGDYPYASYANGGKIHIKKENRGKFTAAANRAGKSVQAYASQILANKENYSPTLVKRANFAKNASKWHAEGGSLNQHWDPKNPHHLHTNDDKVVSFTEDAYNALPSNLKQQTDEHYNAMNTFENQYMVNPEYTEFLKKVKNTNLADNVNASTGEYWDKNWFDPNYKNGAYSFDNNGVLTYKGQTYAPWGNRSSDGITIPMRTPNGVSYGSNYVYYPITIPEQFIERPAKNVVQTIDQQQLNTALQNIYSNYIQNNTQTKYQVNPLWIDFYYDGTYPSYQQLTEINKNNPDALNVLSQMKEFGNLPLYAGSNWYAGIMDKPIPNVYLTKEQENSLRMRAISDFRKESKKDESNDADTIAWLKQIGKWNEENRSLYQRAAEDRQRNMQRVSKRYMKTYKPTLEDAKKNIQVTLDDIINAEVR